VQRDFLETEIWHCQYHNRLIGDQFHTTRQVCNTFTISTGNSLRSSLIQCSCCFK